MTLKQSCFLSAVLLLFTSCLQEPELDLGNPPQKLVLNGLLHPSQPITVRLSLPGGFADTAFVPVTGAEVNLWENGQPLGNLREQGEGVYKLDFLPKPGNRYRITAKAEGLPVVEAEDAVPHRATLVVKSLGEFDERLSFGEYTIDNPTDLVEFFWVFSARNNYLQLNPGVYPPIYDSTQLYWISGGAGAIKELIPQANKQEFYYANDSYDEPPATFYNYLSIYPNMMRMSDLVAPASNIKFESLLLSSFNEERSKTQKEGHVDTRGIYSMLLTASDHYDRYLRSSLLYHENFERFADPNLVATPAPIHSNVQGGYGIFAGFNTDTLFITDEF